MSRVSSTNNNIKRKRKMENQEIQAMETQPKKSGKRQMEADPGNNSEASENLDLLKERPIEESDENQKMEEASQDTSDENLAENLSEKTTVENRDLTVEDFKARLGKHTNLFKVCMEYEYGLNDLMTSKLIFSEEERKKLEDKSHNKSSCEVNESLLHTLKQKTEIEPYKNFLDSLKESLQSHLAGQIYTDGNFRSGNRDRPLTEDQRRRLLVNRNALVPILVYEVPSLVDPMLHKSCINELHKIYIEDTDKRADKARKVLDIVQNRSVYQFEGFRTCLNDIKSKAYELTDLGIIVTIDAQTSAKSGDRKEAIQTENDVAESINSNTSGMVVADNLVIAAATTKSIRLFLKCPSLDSLESLRKSILDGIMRESLEKLFNDRLGSERSGTLLVKKVFPVDFAIKEFYQKCEMASVDLSDVMCDHPLLRNGKEEIEKVFSIEKYKKLLQKERERILMNAFMWRIYNGRKLFSRPDLEAFETLSSVCRDWRDMAKTESFREVIKSSTSKFSKTNQSIKLKCETRINMNAEINCVVNLLDDICVVTKEDPSFIFLYNPHKKAQVSTESGQQAIQTIQMTEKDDSEISRPGEAIKSFLQGQVDVMESIQAAQQPSEEQTEQKTEIPEEKSEPTAEESTQFESKSKRSTTEVLQETLEKMNVADNLDIISMEATDDQKGIFCVSKVDGSVWQWTRPEAEGTEAKTKAKVMKEFSPCTRITISPNGKLRIVVVRDYSAVEIHNSSSELIQTRHFPDHIDQAHDIAWDKRGEILVCYGSDTNPLHRVSRISCRSKAVLAYGDVKGSGYNQLDNPCSIALDQDDDILYVADKGNGRILALDKNLDLINVVLDSKYNKIGAPNAVRFSKSTKRLLVVYKNVMEVYQVSRGVDKPKKQTAGP